MPRFAAGFPTLCVGQLAASLSGKLTPVHNRDRVVKSDNSYPQEPTRLPTKARHAIIVDSQNNNLEHCGFTRKGLAGMVGFEPTIHCTKNSCLTTWLHPSSEALFTSENTADQGLNCEISVIL